MKKWIAIVLALVLILSLAGCGGNAASGSLKIYADGAAFHDLQTAAAAFMEDYPSIRVEVELLPQLRLDYDENYMPVIDTDSQAQRESALQQHRTALMAGSSDADLYLITGGTSQFLELNGGTLVQDTYDLMTAGVLADLTAVMEELDLADYLGGVFEAGWFDGGQYLIPLRVSFNGFVADAADGVDFPESHEAFSQLMERDFLPQMGAIRMGGWFRLPSLTRPVVNKGTETIALYDDDYSTALEEAKEFEAMLAGYTADSGSYSQRIEGGTLVMSGSNPVLCAENIAVTLMREGLTAQLQYIPIPNEQGGVTAEITAYAFAPATSKNQEAAGIFLSWLLSEQSQNGFIPIYSGLGGGYPVRRGCAKALFANSQNSTDTLGYIGTGYADSLAELENRVTHGRFTTSYDYKLLNLLSAWHSGVVADLDVALEELYGEWALYLDE